VVPSSWSLVRASAKKAGSSFVGCWVRSSDRSGSGWVAVAGFASLPVALRFAAVWSNRVAFPVVVRPSGASLFVVSVPVLPPPAGVFLRWQAPSRSAPTGASALEIGWGGSV
jgi:hypothetical protein